ncbi:MULTISPECIES: DUF3727 domain-containing protein [Pseudanabaena]|uniref:DUF3727 domain-containing protein n=1 Tax=Pseudanabaena yagii GIHE-NHR1 TaxID=2722753 RepID=A0ABX1LMT0_9CYAN|nr:MULTISPECIES: DUF3727 domain-containing protein [Pseudanabaena]NMF56460.1 DUF3727 domain-containing protein [Pseudanabaena yagii GIHE-NHR1]
MEGSTIVLTDETGKSLPCTVETKFKVDSTEYLLLQPVDFSVQIFAWQETDDEEETELVDVTEEEIDLIFSTAQAVLSEQNLTLRRSAYTLTVSGELPEPTEEDIIEIDTEEDGNCGEFQELAHFYYEEQAFSVFTALDPLMFIAKVGDDGQPEVLTPAEMAALEPYVEQYLDHVLSTEDAEEEF